MSRKKLHRCEGREKTGQRPQMRLLAFFKQACPMRFGELKKVLKPITNTALTNALKELESDELIQRIQYNEMPLRVEYSLTEKGRDLLPVFYAISQWGMKYIP